MMTFERDIHGVKIGIVKRCDDPAQMGRLKVHIPSVDSDDYSIDDLPWCSYSSPFGGITKNKKRGHESVQAMGPTSYGMWAIPKNGAEVLVHFVNGDPTYRVWTGCVWSLQSNRGLPGGRNVDDSGTLGPFTDSYEAMEPYASNLVESGLNADPHYRTRGQERNVAQAKTDKDGTEGYSPDRSAADGSLDPTSYVFTTPGGHFLSMQDSDEFCRIRLRTTAGKQIILDDTNERIYVSTAKGKCYIEMDEDGHMHTYASESISHHTSGDYNISADGKISMRGELGVNLVSPENVNITSNKSIHVSSDEDVYATAVNAIFMHSKTNNIEASKQFDLSTASANITGSKSIDLSTAQASITGTKGIDLSAGAALVMTGAKIDLNGPPAKTAKVASPSTAAQKGDNPSIKPEHEPWQRPTTSGQRNNNWSE